MYDLVLHNYASLASFGLGLALLLSLLHRAERATGRFVSRRLGWNGLLVTAWIGVPVHELSHLLAAKLFGHRVVGFSLYDPDPASGTLGYVHHAYSRRSWWQLMGQLFIGIAPLVGGGLALLALLLWMLPAERLPALHGELRHLSLGVRALGGAGGVAELGRDVLGYCSRLAAAVWDGRSLWLPLQLYLAAAVACHLAPSARDLQLGALAWVALGLSGLLLPLPFALVGVRLALLPVVLLGLAVVALLALLFQLLWVGCLALLERLRSGPRAAVRLAAR